MVQEYYNLEKAAEVLGIYPAELNERRVPTPRGGVWHARQVARVLERVAPNAA